MALPAGASPPVSLKKSGIAAPAHSGQHNGEHDRAGHVLDPGPRARAATQYRQEIPHDRPAVKAANVGTLEHRHARQDRMEAAFIILAVEPIAPGAPGSLHRQHRCKPEPIESPPAPPAMAREQAAHADIPQTPRVSTGQAHRNGAAASRARRVRLTAASLPLHGRSLNTGPRQRRPWRCGW